VKTPASNLYTDIVTIPGSMTSQLQVLDGVGNNHSKTDYVTCRGNGNYVGTAH
jgi:RNA-splicing ligase RtcB